MSLLIMQGIIFLKSRNGLSPLPMLTRRYRASVLTAPAT
jgi:hypothetical protein